MTIFFLFLLGQEAQTAVNDLNGENSFIVSSLSILLLIFILGILFLMPAQKELQVKTKWD